MGSLREYNVTVNGAPTTMLLNEKDAERLGGTPVDGARRPAADPLVAAPVKARRPANKARTAKDKSDG